MLKSPKPPWRVIAAWFDSFSQASTTSFLFREQTLQEQSKQPTKQPFPTLQKQKQNSLDLFSGQMILEIIQRAGTESFNSFVREKLSASLSPLGEGVFALAEEDTKGFLTRKSGAKSGGGILPSCLLF